MGQASDAPKIADAGPAAWVGYSVAACMAWVFLVGYVSPSASIYMAGISVACLIAYLFGAVTELMLGNVVGGVTWAYFGSFFAGASGFSYLITWMSTAYGWQADGRVQGWMWIVVGIVLILETPIFMKYSNAAAWVSIIAADIGIVTLSFVFWAKGGSVLSDVSGWSFFVAAVGGILNAADGILQGVGWKLPLGSPILQPSKSSSSTADAEAVK